MEERKVGRVVCDWCCMDVLYDPGVYDSEGALRRHKQSTFCYLKWIHEPFFERNLLEPLGVTTA